ncbi:hypothetical protein PQ455_00530 [Sphingomonas naphthae]|uniref:Argininosuccinate lyase n=1 Tax=Sphingomonas naphthae TaxID=1813468 RepID=A0ABY7TLW2_9SPHN|nr:hypothetical protein [Sphingomonas naphthae]WCT73751.1 hypothetical protein PQ455_00530 [Sphingomonas naphthae]
MTKRIVLIAGCLMLAGCGGKQVLQPAEGRQLPPRPALAQTTPSPDQLLGVPPAIQPGRSDELLTKSEERRDDRFSLPPP